MVTYIHHHNSNHCCSRSTRNYKLRKPCFQSFKHSDSTTARSRLDLVFAYECADHGVIVISLIENGLIYIHRDCN